MSCFDEPFSNSPTEGSLQVLACYVSIITWVVPGLFDDKASSVLGSTVAPQASLKPKGLSIRGWGVDEIDLPCCPRQYSVVAGTFSAVATAARKSAVCKVLSCPNYQLYPPRPWSSVDIVKSVLWQACEPRGIALSHEESSLARIVPVD